jgi:hypothetical protein
VEEVIFSAASWSDGSAVATISQLLRLLSTTILATNFDVEQAFGGLDINGIKSRSRCEGDRHGVKQVRCRYGGTSQLTNETGSSIGLYGKYLPADFVRVFLPNQRTAKPGNAKVAVSLFAVSAAAISQG